jgi:hypothetical protein
LQQYDVSSFAAAKNSAEICRFDFCSFRENCRKGTLSAEIYRFMQKEIYRFLPAESVPLSAISAERNL